MKMEKILKFGGMVFYVLFLVVGIMAFGSKGRGWSSDFLNNGLLFAINGSILFIGSAILTKLDKSE